MKFSHERFLDHWNNGTVFDKIFISLTIVIMYPILSMYSRVDLPTLENWKRLDVKLVRTESNIQFLNRLPKRHSDALVYCFTGTFDESKLPNKDKCDYADGVNVLVNGRIEHVNGHLRYWSLGCADIQYMEYLRHVAFILHSKYNEGIY